MNLSLHQQTITGLVDDHKAIIDQHQKDIDELKNRQPMVMPEIKGDGLDMAQLMNMFASKNPPENTIVRIEELEKQMLDLLNKKEPEREIVQSAGPGLDQDALDRLNDLLKRVQGLEVRADKTDREQVIQDERLDDHDRRLKGLEEMDMSAPIGATGDIDTAAILKQVNLVR